MHSMILFSDDITAADGCPIRALSKVLSDPGPVGRVWRAELEAFKLIDVVCFRADVVVARSVIFGPFF